jgi:hypothetical protein
VTLRAWRLDFFFFWRGVSNVGADVDPVRSVMMTCGFCCQGGDEPLACFRGGRPGLAFIFALLQDQAKDFEILGFSSPGVIRLL